MTIKSALNVSSRSVSSRDAEVFLATALEVERAYLHAHPEQELTPAQAERYEQFLARRETNEPVAHIIGTREFYGRPFKADGRALIPRPETEALVEHAVRLAATHFKTHVGDSNLPCPVRIAELGTGGGCIAITVALELAKASVPATIVASEIAPEALQQAHENWEALSKDAKLGNIQLKFVRADMFAHEELSKRPFDIILANLPYVEDTWRVNPLAQEDVIFFEPEVALFGGSDGLDLYRQFFAEAPAHLTEDGAIVIEYGEMQTPILVPVIKAAFPGKSLLVHKDYADLDRVITIS